MTLSPLATVLLGLMALHVAGALKHRIVDRQQGALKRMWFGN